MFYRDKILDIALRILCGVVMTMTVIGCTHYDEYVVSTTTEETDSSISFSANISSEDSSDDSPWLSKATIYDSVDELESFVVFAYLTEQTKWKDISSEAEGVQDVTFFMNNQEVYRNEDDSSSETWLYSPVKYWPINYIDGEVEPLPRYISFLSIAPAGLGSTISTVTDANGIASIRYVLSGSAVENQDILWSTIVKDKYIDDPDVTFGFEHATTRLSVKVKLKNQFAGSVYAINGLSFYNIEAAGYIDYYGNGYTGPTFYNEDVTYEVGQPYWRLDYDVATADITATQGHTFKDIEGQALLNFNHSTSSDYKDEYTLIHNDDVGLFLLPQHFEKSKTERASLGQTTVEPYLKLRFREYYPYYYASQTAKAEGTHTIYDATAAVTPNIYVDPTESSLWARNQSWLAGSAVEYPEGVYMDDDHCDVFSTYDYAIPTPNDSGLWEPGQHIDFNISLDLDSTNDFYMPMTVMALVNDYTEVYRDVYIYNNRYIYIDINDVEITGIDEFTLYAFTNYPNDDVEFYTYSSDESSKTAVTKVVSGTRDGFGLTYSDENKEEVVYELTISTDGYAIGENLLLEIHIPNDHIYGEGESAHTATGADITKIFYLNLVAGVWATQTEVELDAQSGEVILYITTNSSDPEISFSSNFGTVSLQTLDSQSGDESTYKLVLSGVDATGYVVISALADDLSTTASVPYQIVDNVTDYYIRIVQVEAERALDVVDGNAVYYTKVRLYTNYDGEVTYSTTNNLTTYLDGSYLIIEGVNAGDEITITCSSAESNFGNVYSYLPHTVTIIDEIIPDYYFELKDTTLSMLSGETSLDVTLTTSIYEGGVTFSATFENSSETITTHKVTETVNDDGTTTLTVEDFDIGGEDGTLRIYATYSDGTTVKVGNIDVVNNEYVYPDSYTTPLLSDDSVDILFTSEYTDTYSVTAVYVNGVLVGSTEYSSSIVANTDDTYNMVLSVEGVKVGDEIETVITLRNGLAFSRVITVVEAEVVPYFYLVYGGQNYESGSTITVSYSYLNSKGTYTYNFSNSDITIDTNYSDLYSDYVITATTSFSYTGQNSNNYNPNLSATVNDSYTTLSFSVSSNTTNPTIYINTYTTVTVSVKDGSGNNAETLAEYTIKFTD